MHCLSPRSTCYFRLHFFRVFRRRVLGSRGRSTRVRVSLANEISRSIAIASRVMLAAVAPPRSFAMFAERSGTTENEEHVRLASAMLVHNITRATTGGSVSRGGGTLMQPGVRRAGRCCWNEAVLAEAWRYDSRSPQPEHAGNQRTQPSWRRTRRVERSGCTDPYRPIGARCAHRSHLIERAGGHSSLEDASQREAVLTTR